MVPQSQIGFIDFIVVPTLGIAGDAMSLVLCSRQENKEIQKPWNEILLVNKSKWQAKVRLNWEFFNSTGNAWHFSKNHYLSPSAGKRRE